MSTIQPTPNDARVLQDMRAKLDAIKGGPGVSVQHTKRGLLIGLTGGPPVPRGDSSLPYVRITAASRDGSNWRWTYTVTPVQLTAQGYGGWQTISGAASVTAYNTLENMNGTSGLVGSGITLSNLPAGFELKPAPVGAIVRAELIGDGTSTPCYWFEFANSVDGTCP